MHNLNTSQLKHHAAIGGVALQWTHLENLVQSILWRVAEIDPRVGRCITHHMPFQSLCNAIITIANETPALQPLASELKEFFQECDKLRIKRNDTVHALWATFLPTSNGEQQVIYRNANEFEGMIIKARGNLNIKINRTTASEIDDISEEILVFSTKLANFIQEKIPTKVQPV